MRRVREEQFHPGWLGVFVNPYYFSRAALRDEVERAAGCFLDPVLDIGCGTRPYQRFVRGRYVGIDVPSRGARIAADVVYDGTRFPFGDSTFRSVLCTEVLEHVREPEEFIAEVHRVLCAEGVLFLTVPLMWGEHEVPNDFRRYSSYGIKQFLEINGFQVLEFRRTNADVRALFQLAIAYSDDVLRNLPRSIRLPLLLPITVAANLLGLAAFRLLPRNEKFYLDCVVLARRM